MKIILQYLKQHKKVLIFALILASINQIFSLLDPQIFRLIIDNYATRITELEPSEFIKGVLLLLLASVGVAFVSRVAKAFQDYYVNVTMQKVGTEMYAKGVSHAFSLPFFVFEDQRSGEVLNRLQKARDDSQAFIGNAINVVFLSVIGMIFVISYAFYVHWMIGLTYFLIIPVLGSITFFLSKKIRQAQKNIVNERAELAGSTTETLRNVELVKSLGLEEQEIKRLNNVNEKVLELELKKVKLVRALDFAQGTMINAIRSGLLLLMLWLIFKDAISLGEFFSLLFYSFAIFTPLYNLGEFTKSYQEARASNEELQNILSMEPEEIPKNAKHIDTIQNITYKDIGFTYNGSEIPALKDISFSIKKGNTIAFVGPSGSGKSTILKILAGLYKPTSGKMTFNEHDAKELDFNEIRKKIGLVSQETQLFAGTIKENLLFVRPNATDEDCKEALKLAQAESIIQRGDKGLETRIGEGGIKLSGGERQRLAIARALLREPHILIFDEATSSLDSLTEKEITKTIQAIEKERPDLITILVAHRLSTVLHANTIYVLEKGRIIETGTHESLVKEGGLYAALWKEQSASNPRELPSS